MNRMAAFFFVAFGLSIQSMAAVQSLHCYMKNGDQLPVVNLKLDGRTVIEAREVWRSPLRGDYFQGDRLLPIPTDIAGVYYFDVGSYYTQDLTLVVDTRSENISVNLDTYDRDDGKGTSEALFCRP